MACVVEVSDICAPGQPSRAPASTLIRAPGSSPPVTASVFVRAPWPPPPVSAYLMSRFPPPQEGSVPLSGVVRTAALLEVPSEANRMQGCPVGPCPSAEALGEFVGLRKLFLLLPGGLLFLSSCPSALHHEVQEE